jgi:hypothetical protein
MDKMHDRSLSVTEVLDGFVNYKFNRYMNKIGIAVKKMKGEVTCDSDIL